MFTFNLFTRKVGAGNDWYEMIFTFNMRFTQVMVFSLQETILKSKPPMNLKNHKALTFCFQMLQVQTWLMCSPVKQTWCQVTCKRLSRWFCWHIKFKRITSDSWVELFWVVVSPQKTTSTSPACFVGILAFLGWVFWVIPLAKPSRHIRPARKDGHRQFWNIWINCQWGNFQGVEKHLGNTGNCHPPWN